MGRGSPDLGDGPLGTAGKVALVCCALFPLTQWPATGDGREESRMSDLAEKRPPEGPPAQGSPPPEGGGSGDGAGTGPFVPTVPVGTHCLCSHPPSPGFHTSAAPLVRRGIHGPGRLPRLPGCRHKAVRSNVQPLAGHPDKGRDLLGLSHCFPSKSRVASFPRHFRTVFCSVQKSKQCLCPVCNSEFGCQQ